MKKLILAIAIMASINSVSAQNNQQDSLVLYKKSVATGTKINKESEAKKLEQNQHGTPAGFVNISEIRNSYGNNYRALQSMQKTEQEKNAETIERENERLRKNIQRSNNLHLQNVLGQYINYASQQLLVGFPYVQ
jgi:hypothetical protein